MEELDIIEGVGVDLKKLSSLLSFIVILEESGGEDFVGDLGFDDEDFCLDFSLSCCC